MEREQNRAGRGKKGVGSRVETGCVICGRRHSLVAVAQLRGAMTERNMPLFSQRNEKEC